MPTNTLTSLAILKVNIDHGGDYLDYLRPFILQTLLDYDLDPITDIAVKQCLQEQFSLEIPERTIEIVLKRLSRRHAIKRDHGVYRKTGELPDPELAVKQAEAERHIRAVLQGLRQFSQGTINPIDSDEQAIIAICAFLADFDVVCLRAYLRGTAIPQYNHIDQTDISLVSQYVQEIYKSSPERFNSFLVLVQGHMLANALLCPDLQNYNQTYKDVTFFLDTPLLLHALGLTGEGKESAAHELVDLLTKLGGKVAAFSHSCQELQGVLRAVATNLDSPDAHGEIVHEARKHSLNRSDILLLAEETTERLRDAGIQVETTPRYLEIFQIDETVFEDVLTDEVSYQNPRAKEYDINSVRSIYTLRANKPSPTVERARAVFVTNNGSFARAAWKYGQQHESSYDVSSVINSFSLANIAWLKGPMGAPSIPRTQLLAISYAALQPSTRQLNRFMAEIDRLEAQGKINKRDHQLLRSSPLVQDELMHLTLGEDEALTEDTIMQTLERISSEIRGEESEKLVAEQEAHRMTRHHLESSRQRNEEIRSSIYWKCQKTANLQSKLLIYLLGLLMIADLGAGIIMPFIFSVTLSLVAVPVILAVSFFTFMSRWYGISVEDARRRLDSWLLSRLLRREARILGIDVQELLP